VTVLTELVPAARATVGRRKIVELAVLLLVSVPLLFTALDLSFLDPDEGLYAEIARAMLADGDWVIPHFNGLPYLEKPPLYFWLSAATLRVAPGSEAAVRLWSALTALGSVLLVWRIGRRLYGSFAGVVAGVALATSAGFALYVRKASTDFVFMFCLALAMYGYLRDAERPGRGPARFLLFYAGTALALLSKGLIGLVFPVVIVGLVVAWERRLRPAEWNLARGLAVFAAIAAPWHLLILWREPGLAWFYVVDNQILRFLNARAFIEDDVPVGTLAYLVLSFIWFYPWSPLVLARPAAARARGALLMPVWAVTVIVFFALSRSKLEYYALPALPALAVLVGAAWSAGRDVGRWLVVGAAGACVVGVTAVWIGARLTPDMALNGLAELNVYYRILRDQGIPFPFASAAPFGELLVALGLTLCVGPLAAAVAWWIGRQRLAFGALATVGVVIACLIVRLLYLVEDHHSVRAVAAALTAEAASTDVIAHEGSLEYSASLPFYTARRIVVVDGMRGDLDIASRRPEARGMFLDGPALVRQWSEGPRLFLVTQRPRPLSVVALLPAGHVTLLGQFGSRWLYVNR